MLVMITVENTRLQLRFERTRRHRNLYPMWEARSEPLRSSWWLLREFPLQRCFKKQRFQQQTPEDGCLQQERLNGAF